MNNVATNTAASTPQAMPLMGQNMPMMPQSLPMMPQNLPMMPMMMMPNNLPASQANGEGISTNFAENKRQSPGKGHHIEDDDEDDLPEIKFPESYADIKV